MRQLELPVGVQLRNVWALRLAAALVHVAARLMRLVEVEISVGGPVTTRPLPKLVHIQLGEDADERQGRGEARTGGDV